MNIQKISSNNRNTIIKATSKAAASVAKKICKLYPAIKKVQPHITGIDTGMGTWSFNGYGIGTSTEDDYIGEEVKINDINISDVISNGSPDWYDFPINKELIEIVKLVDLLVDTGELNCSTWQDGFNENGVIFYHSETSNQNNPFSTPNKEYFMGLEYYKQLVKANVPVCFLDYDLIKH